MTRSATSNEFVFIQGLTAELSAKELIFPTSLNTTMKIRHALSDEGISNDTLARIIGTEPVLSAQVLRFCNSAAFNRSNKRTANLRTAAMRLGFSVVRNIAISVGMKQLSEFKTAGEFSQRIEGLWSRSVRVAALSYVIARNLTKINPDRAMMAGLLHDVGKFYILNRARHHATLFSSERALWDIVDQWHANIGAAILENWGISDEIRSAVMEHRNIDRSHSGAPDLIDVLTAADFLDAHFYANSEAMLDWDCLPHALAHLQLNHEKSKTLLHDTKEELYLIFQSLI
jgi:putative nucleotidyltransferase with HDIG domain